MTMKVTEMSKLTTLILVVIGAVFLCFFGKISGDAAIGVMGAALGYVFGNGHGIISATNALKGGGANE